MPNDDDFPTSAYDHTGAPKRWDGDRQHLPTTADMQPLAAALAHTETRAERAREAMAIVFDLATYGVLSPELLARAEALAQAVMEDGIR